MNVCGGRGGTHTSNTDSWSILGYEKSTWFVKTGGLRSNITVPVAGPEHFPRPGSPHFSFVALAAKR